MDANSCSAFKSNLVETFNVKKVKEKKKKLLTLKDAKK